jgi:hypothetical protein
MRTPESTEASMPVPALFAVPAVDLAATNVPRADPAGRIITVRGSSHW